MVKAKQQPNEHIWTELVNSCASTSASLPACFQCAIADYVLTLEVCAAHLEEVARLLNYVEEQNAGKLNMLSPYNCFMGKCLEMGATGTTAPKAALSVSQRQAC
jgi:hypothetical protein